MLLQLHLALRDRAKQAQLLKAAGTRQGAAQVQQQAPSRVLMVNQEGRERPPLRNAAWRARLRLPHRSYRKVTHRKMNQADPMAAIFEAVLHRVHLHRPFQSLLAYKL